MRLANVVLGLVAILAVSPSAQGELAGTWKIELICEGMGGRGFSMPTELALKTEGTKLTGTALMGHWPGNSRIEGRIEGDRFSFTAIGEANSSNGFARMGFSGTLKGDVLTLSMDRLNWIACLTCADDLWPGNQLSKKITMVGRKTAN